MEASAERVVELAGDASARRYARRLRPGAPPVVECRYPPGEADTLERDLAVRSWLADRGLPVPVVLAVDRQRRIVTCEDLGDVDGAAALAAASPSARVVVMTRLLAPLGALATIPVSELPAWNPPLAEPLLRFELTGFELWYLRHHRRVRPPAAVGTWLDELVVAVAGHSRRVCHRDYHLNNLFLDPAGQVRVLDEQDVRPGPDCYDLVSLLWERDAVRLLDDAQRRELVATWADVTGAPPGVSRRVAAVRCQRGLKVLGTFARLVAAGRPQYADWLGPLAHDLAGPLAGVGAPTWLTSLLLD